MEAFSNVHGRISAGGSCSLVSRPQRLWSHVTLPNQHSLPHAKGAPGDRSQAVGSDVLQLTAPAAESIWPSRLLKGIDLVPASEESDPTLAKAAESRPPENCGHHRRGAEPLGLGTRLGIMKLTLCHDSKDGNARGLAPHRRKPSMDPRMAWVRSWPRTDGLWGCSKVR